MTEDVLGGRYRVVSALPAIGGIPRDLAVDTVTDEHVEVSRLARSGPLPEAFGEVAARHAAIHHPVLAPVLAWSQPGTSDQSTPLYVEAHRPGPRLAPGIVLPRRAALLAGADLASAVAALHAAGLAHGALELAAVTLDHDGKPHLLGAGLPALQALAIGAAAPAPAPDDDLRALGRVLYALLCGEQPASDPQPPAAIVPDLDPVVNGLVMSLAADDPFRPPPPAAAVSLRLRELAGEPPRDDLGPPPLVAAPRRALPSDAPLAIGAAVLAIGGILAAYGIARAGDEDRAPARTTTTEHTVTLVLPATAAALPPTASFDTNPDTSVLTGDTSAGATTVFETVTSGGEASTVTVDHTLPAPRSTLTYTFTTTLTAPRATTRTFTFERTATTPDGAP